MSVNSFEYVDWVMQESLDVLVNKMAIASGAFNMDVQKEFEHDFAPGETVRVKFPFSPQIRDGLNYSDAPIVRRHTTVACNQPFGIDFGWDAFEKALKLERGKDILKREYIDPCMVQLNQEIESRAAQWARLNTGTIVGALGTALASFDLSSAAARQKLTELGCPPEERSIFVGPDVMRTLKGTVATAFNPVTDVSKALRTGIVGYGDGFDWHESVSLYKHTAGTWASTVSIKGNGQSGTALTITATAGDTFNAGDKFSIANCNPVNPRTKRRVGSAAKTYCVATALTAVGGGVDVLNITQPIFGPGTPDQNVDALPVDGAALTLFPGTTLPNGLTGTVNIAAHRNAFAMVSVGFDIPKEGGNIVISRKLTDPDTGIQISLLRAFEPRTMTWITRFDTCLGFGNLYSDNCAVAVLGA